jgi:DNA-3-methyladenine glycosylase II|tara:strand:- start:879 stop:1502 length:624 start_codon:yes stop_codon:yes gene_type:complete
MNLKWNKEMLKAFQQIIKIDHDIKIIYEKFGYPENRSVSEGFESLTKIIIGQQISTNVAKKIYGNLKNKNVLNETVLYQMPLEELKSYGLSSQKSYYIQNLAYLVYNNHLDLKKLKYMTGDQVINILIKVKGIGQWTINNYRIFALQDVDAWPSADLALQESTKLIKKINLRPKQEEMEKIAAKWKPYRGAAALFLWHFYNKIKLKK